MERGGVNTIGKQHFTYLYSPAREKTLTKKNILAGWRGSGLFPFNPDRVLADTPKPPPGLIIQKADKVREGSCPQYEALPTPVTPVSAEALTALLNMVKQVPSDETSRQHKERLQKKVTTAAQTFLAKNALLEDRNQFLTNINDEGKVRRSTKSEILGKVRVMSYEDLEKARTKRAMKEAAKEAKKGAKEVKKIATTGKSIRGRKRKSPEEAGAPEPKAKVARMSEAQVEEDEIAPQPWRAPVAQMW